MALPVQQLGSLRTCPVIIGLWQLAGGHGAINAATAASEIQRYLDNGFTTFDMAGMQIHQLFNAG